MLKTELKESKFKLKELNKAFNLVEPEFVEVIIYEQLAEEARFNALLRVARSNNHKGEKQ